MTSTHRLKLWICIACLASSMAAPAYEPNLGISMDLIDLAAISRMTPQQLEVLAEGLAAQEFMRTKRSSAAALTAAVASKASSSSGLQSKVGLLGQASAGAVSFISSASSKSGHGDDHPGYSYEPQESKVDFWGLKKSILYTLFQAVKAITGGVTILKGQLIKGGGALASTLGKVIKVKGEAVSNFGKKIVNSAALSHKPAATIHHHHHPAPVYGPPSPPHLDYPPSSYGAPTAPAHFAHAPPSGPPSGFSAHKYPSQLDVYRAGASSRTPRPPGRMWTRTNDITITSPSAPSPTRESPNTPTPVKCFYSLSQSFTAWRREGPADYTKGIFQTLGFKEFHKYLMMKPKERESAAGKKLLEASIENMKMATRRYARRQNKMVRGRFLEHPHREIPPIYELDTTDVSKWEENVQKKALQIIQSYLDGTTCEYEPLKSIISEEQRKIDGNSRNYCKTCERLIIGDRTFKLHLESVKHKKVLNIKKRKERQAKKAKGKQ